MKTITLTTTTKPTRLFSRFNVTLLALAVALGGTLLFAGCATTDGGSSNTWDSNNSRHQHHH